MEYYRCWPVRTAETGPIPTDSIKCVQPLHGTCGTEGPQRKRRIWKIVFKPSPSMLPISRVKLPTSSCQVGETHPGLWPKTSKLLGPYSESGASRSFSSYQTSDLSDSNDSGAGSGRSAPASSLES